MADQLRLQVPEKFTRSAIVDKDWSRASAIWQINYVCEQLGLSDLSESAVLDMGCGVKMTETLINEGLPIKRYVGIDVYGEMIDFLRSNVEDPRFEYFHVPLHNDLYNPAGERLTASTRLPVPIGGFDVIWLFSVFTHLAPDDFHAMLRVLRPHARDSGRLVFSLTSTKRPVVGMASSTPWPGPSGRSRSSSSVVAGQRKRRSRGSTTSRLITRFAPLCTPRSTHVS